MPHMLKALTLTILVSAVFNPSALQADSQLLDSDSGIVHIMVRNEDGVSARESTVYISDGRRLVDMVETDENGHASVVLQRGNYIITSGRLQPIADAINRYSSSEAHISVMPMDENSVILTLYPLPDPIANLSLSTLQKIGVADELAKYLN
jgi:hypothetical protein